jgi:hypothetical protein
MMRDLFAEAHRLGVIVRIRPYPPDWQGCYVDGSGTINLSDHLGEGMWMRCTLAHELGHAYYRHRVTTKTTEKQANERAAELLIDLNDYARAERISDNISYLAHELDVTKRIIWAYQSRLHRLRIAA